MAFPYVTTQDERLRRVFVASDAHSLAVTSGELASEVDTLSHAIRVHQDHVIDIENVESQLAIVRRRCVDVRTGVANTATLAESSVAVAESVVRSARDLLAQAEAEFNRAWFEVNFATIQL